jgi:hypothetical protein
VIWFVSSKITVLCGIADGIVLIVSTSARTDELEASQPSTRAYTQSWAISGPLSTANYGHSRYLPSTFRRLKSRVSAA